jgi:hypothetical protein
VSQRQGVIGELTQRDQQARASATSEARRLYPWQWDAKSPEFTLAKQVLDERPGLKQDPAWQLVLGRYVTGMVAEQKLARSAALPLTAAPMKKPSGGRTPPPVVTTPAAAPPQISGDSAVETQIQTARDQYRKTGSVKDKARLDQLVRSLRRAAA